MQNADFSRGQHTRYKPKIFPRSGYVTIQILPENASLFHKTRILPDASIPATTEKFSAMAGIQRSRFCRKMRHFSTKRGFFPMLAYPLQRKNFPPWQVCSTTDFVPRSEVFRRQTRPKYGQSPADWRRRTDFHAKRRFSPGLAYPLQRKNFPPWRVYNDPDFAGKCVTFPQNTDFPRG